MNMNPLISSIVGSVVRWALNILAGSGVVISDELTSQVISGVVALITLGWTIYSNYKQHKEPKA